MKRINNIIVISSMLFALLAPMALAAQESQEKAYIEWKPGEGAVMYKIEITDLYNDLVADKTTEATKLEIDLPYGKYRYRVGTVTKFNKVYSWTEWRTLSIVPALEPKITADQQKSIPSGDSTELTIKGENFYKSSEVIISKAGSKLKIKNMRYVNPGTLVVTVDTRGAKPGDYDIMVKNAGDLMDLKAVSKNHLTINPAPEKQGIEYYVGIEFGYISPIFPDLDAYSGSLGFKLFGEFRSLGRAAKFLSFLNKAPGLYPGLELSFFGFLAPKQGFGTSFMLQLGFYFGYEFTFRLMKDLVLNVSPILGLKGYFRWHEFEGAQYFGAKPILFFGAKTTFDLPMRFYIGLSLDYNVIFEQKPMTNIGIYFRCGYRI